MFVSLLQKIYNRYVFGLARLRSFFWGIFLKKKGEVVSIFSGCIIASPSGVSLGNYVAIGRNSVISGAGSLTIGNYVMIGQNCNILTSQHGYDDIVSPMMMQDVTIGDICIKDNVWIGVNVVILPGVTINEGAIIGANSLVNKDVGPYSVVGGLPAKLIRVRE